MNPDLKEISKAKRKIKRIVKKILMTQKRQKPTYLGVQTLTKQSGDLFNRSDVRFIKKGSSWVFQVDLMDYYLYLDEGTETIEPWFFTEEIIKNSDIADALEDATAESLDKILGSVINNLTKK